MTHSSNLRYAVSLSTVVLILAGAGILPWCMMVPLNMVFGPTEVIKTLNGVFGIGSITLWGIAIYLIKLNWAYVRANTLALLRRQKK
jgi:hypothetical protein